MAAKNVIKDNNFKPMNEVRPDAKRRITLGKAIKLESEIYMVYENDLGQIILDPMELIPKHEGWLHKNPKALLNVIQGIKDAAEGKLRESPEDFSSHAAKESDA